MVKEGDKVWVKLMGFDERGKVRLSMKVVDQATASGSFTPSFFASFVSRSGWKVSHITASSWVSV